jgi:hypothetical protein
MTEQIPSFCLPTARHPSSTSVYSTCYISSFLYDECIRLRRALTSIKTYPNIHRRSRHPPPSTLHSHWPPLLVNNSSGTWQTSKVNFRDRQSVTSQLDTFNSRRSCQEHVQLRMIGLVRLGYDRGGDVRRDVMPPRSEPAGLVPVFTP